MLSQFNQLAVISPSMLQLTLATVAWILQRMEYDVWPLGDRALLLQFGNSVCAATNRLVHAACAALVEAQLKGVELCAPAYSSLILQLNITWLERNGGVEGLQARVHEVLAGVGASECTITDRVLEIPTRYGGANGPDLDEVAARLGLTPAQVIELHAQPVYQVAMIGFMPGFPYLLGLPECLQLPRRESVRRQVPAGSVAIAGTQAGIYPQSSPGGWHLIGRTDLGLFDANRSSPSWLAPGDRVRFVPAGGGHD